ncbi:MAG: DNA methyltransferase [Roseovarius sp.]|nr:DNA methyltransferase [Roseovarius sp.]
MNSESVDLIYLDPPFNSNANYAAPIGSQAAGAEFKDTWGLDDLKVAWHGLIKSQHPALYSYLAAVKDIHSSSMMAYLIYMAVRIMEMKRLLKPTGSIYLHCDSYAGHYLKILMDSIWPNNLRNEIIWQRSTASGGKAGGKKFVPGHDTILYYTINDMFTHNRQYIPYTKEYIEQRFVHKDDSGRRYRLQLGNRKQYLDLSKGKPVSDIWTDVYPVNPMAKEKTGYPTQKPLALLRRIIKASSNKGNIILDPFCGCATACIAAEELQRQWIGIDISPKAAELIELRMQKELGMFFEGSIRKDIPQRTDMEHIRRYNHPENKQILYGKQGGHCNGCKEHFQTQHLEIDHIQPRSKGGTDHLDNLQLLCGSCNRIKGNRTQEYLMSVLNDKGFIKFAA